MLSKTPRWTSLENTQPLLTFANYRGDVYFIHDLRGYVAIVYELAFTFLQHKDGKIIDPRLKLTPNPFYDTFCTLAKQL